jgi:putative SOS response-associated peptidase YedK
MHDYRYGGQRFASIIHNRMPVILEKSDIGLWLNGTAGTEILRPVAEDRLQMWPVSRRSTRLALAMMIPR